MTKLGGRLSQIHLADDAAVAWPTMTNTICYVAVCRGKSYMTSRLLPRWICHTWMQAFCLIYVDCVTRSETTHILSCPTLHNAFLLSQIYTVILLTSLLRLSLKKWSILERLDWSWCQSVRSEPAGDLSYKPSGRLPLFSAMTTVTCPASQHHGSLASTKFYCLVTETRTV